MENKPELTPCEFCGKIPNEPRMRYYSIAEILQQTPRSVWDEYRANGYTIYEAIKEEWSYA